uniref:ribonuclease H n=1 Tax=Leptobrachium leishanense TaxID=445787 RepID=A0A8C5WGQ2_9ANUR
MEPASIPDTLALITNQLSNLTHSIVDLQNNQAAIQNHLSRLDQAQGAEGITEPPAEAPSVTEISATSHEPYVSPPNKFDGDRKQFRVFITSCQIMFSIQRKTYASDFVKIRTVISLLTGKPQVWAHHLLRTAHPSLRTWNTFYNALEAMYEDPNRLASAAQALELLKQGKDDVEDYITEFKHLALDSEWNEPALLAQFRKGLSEVLKDELARTGIPSSLEATMTLCTQIDRRLRERRAERSASHVHTPVKRYMQTPPVITSTTSPSEEEPMQIGVVRGPLTENEKSRRRSLGLCMYCGRPGHQVRECRAKPPSRSGEPAQPTTSVATHDLCTVTPSHIIVSLLLQWDQCAVPLRAMIDSGASGCFVDEKIAVSLGIPIVPKSHSYAIQLLDGSSPISGPIVKETRPLLVSLGTTHRDTIVFDVVTSPVFPAVLGLNWLRRNNPSIDWSSGAVSFGTETNIPTTDLHTCKNLTIAMCLEVPEPYQAFSHVFEKKGADTLPPHRPYDCPVDLLPGAPIPYGRLYPLSEPELLVLKDYIDDNLQKGFIRPSTSPAGAPIFFVGKKDGGLRPCVDYRAMNAITIKDKYPLPLISELMDRLRSANIFTKLDLRGAYNLIRVKSGDEWKTAFRSRYGHYEYMVMPYGLCNAPATFQRFLNDVFRDILDSYIVIYLDDILIYSQDLETHRKHVKTVLRRLQEQRLYAKAEKCIFDTDKVEFLGFIISPGNIRMDPSKTEAVATWPVPANKKGVQSFIGFCNFYRKFIRNFSTIIRPLTR